jgi:hypothetical protein
MWKEIKTWATKHGYNVDRTKVQDSENSYNYVWQCGNDSGTAQHVENVATDIYNHMTSGTYISYQQLYKDNKSYNISSQQSHL